MSQSASILLSDSDVREIVQAVSATFTDLERYAAPPRNDLAGAQAVEKWTGSINVSGAFNGAITLGCSRSFARHAARAMFGQGATDEVSDAAARDALAELTNMVGGNMKSLLSSITKSTCSLSLPVITIGSADRPGTRPLQQWLCACGQEQILVRLFEGP